MEFFVSFWILYFILVIIDILCNNGQDERKFGNLLELVGFLCRSVIIWFYVLLVPDQEKTICCLLKFNSKLNLGMYANVWMLFLFLFRSILWTTWSITWLLRLGLPGLPILHPFHLLEVITFILKECVIEDKLYELENLLFRHAICVSFNYTPFVVDYF